MNIAEIIQFGIDLLNLAEHLVLHYTTSLKQTAVKGKLLTLEYLFSIDTIQSIIYSILEYMCELVILIISMNIYDKIKYIKI